MQKSEIEQLLSDYDQQKGFGRLLIDSKPMQYLREYVTSDCQFKKPDQIIKFSDFYESLEASQKVNLIEYFRDQRKQEPWDVDTSAASASVPSVAGSRPNLTYRLFSQWFRKEAAEKAKQDPSKQLLDDLRLPQDVIQAISYYLNDRHSTKLSMVSTSFLKKIQAINETGSIVKLPDYEKKWRNRTINFFTSPRSLKECKYVPSVLEKLACKTLYSGILPLDKYRLACVNDKASTIEIFDLRHDAQQFDFKTFSFQSSFKDGPPKRMEILNPYYHSPKIIHVPSHPLNKWHERYKYNSEFKLIKISEKLIAAYYRCSPKHVFVYDVKVCKLIHTLSTEAEGDCNLLVDKKHLIVIHQNGDMELWDLDKFERKKKTAVAVFCVLGTILFDSKLVAYLHENDDKIFLRTFFKDSETFEDHCLDVSRDKTKAWPHLHCVSASKFAFVSEDRCNIFDVIIDDNKVKIEKTSSYSWRDLFCRANLPLVSIDLSVQSVILPNGYLAFISSSLYGASDYRCLYLLICDLNSKKLIKTDYLGIYHYTGSAKLQVLSNGDIAVLHKHAKKTAYNRYYSLSSSYCSPELSLPEKEHIITIYEFETLGLKETPKEQISSSFRR